MKSAKHKQRRSRRRFLYGSAGCAVALPLLPSLLDAQEDIPKRFIAIYAPGGVIQNGGAFHDLDHWSVGENFANLDVPTHILHELRDFKSELIQVRNTRRESFFYGTGTLGLAGAIGHWGEHANYLTGSALKPNGRETGWSELETDDASIDHKIAALTGHRPLNIGAMPVRSAKVLDTVSWLSASQADTWLDDPLEIYAKIFGDPEQQANRERFRNLLQLRRSVLDSVVREQAALNGRLSRADRHHLDNYFSTIRDTEQRIAETRDLTCVAPPMSEFDNADLYAQSGLAVQLALIALECDMTRVVTASTWGAGGGVGGQIVGSYVPGMQDPVRDYHYFTHFATSAGGVEQARYEDYLVQSKWSAQFFASFVKGLSERMDADGNSMLHNSLVMYGSAIGDASHHQYRDVARMFAGRAGGSITPNRVIDGSRVDPSDMSKRLNAPAENLLPEILDIFGVKDAGGAPIDKVGLSDDVLSLRS